MVLTWGDLLAKLWVAGSAGQLDWKVHRLAVVRAAPRDYLWGDWKAVEMAGIWVDKRENQTAVNSVVLWERLKAELLVDPWVGVSAVKREELRGLEWAIQLAES